MAPDLTVRDLLVKEDYCPIYSGPRLVFYGGAWYTAWSSTDYNTMYIARAVPADLETWTVIASATMYNLAFALDLHETSLYILFRGYAPGDYTAYWLRRYDIATDTWYDAEYIGQSSTSAYATYHARVHEDTLYMLWYDGGSGLCYSKKALPDGTPTTKQRVAGWTPMSYVRTASLAILPDDTILVAYDHYDGTYRVRVARRDGSSWTEELVVSGGYSGIYANLETGEAWLGYTGAVTGPRVFARMRSAAGVWGSVEYVTEDYTGDTDLGNFRHPVFAFDKAGVVYCAVVNHTSNPDTRRPVMCYKYDGEWLPKGKYNEIDLGSQEPRMPYVAMVTPWQPADNGAMFLCPASTNGEQRLAVVGEGGGAVDREPEEKPIWRTARVMNAGRHPRNMGREVRSGINE